MTAQVTAVLILNFLHLFLFSQPAVGELFCVSMQNFHPGTIKKTKHHIRLL